MLDCFAMFVMNLASYIAELKTYVVNNFFTTRNFWWDSMVRFLKSYIYISQTILNPDLEIDALKLLQ